mgnify:FL=1
MSLDRVANLASANVGAVSGVNPVQAPNLARVGNPSLPGPSFEETLRKVSQLPVQAPKAEGALPLTFSKHAVERMKSRGISGGPEVMDRLEKAFAKASEKGSRNTLVFMDGNAFIMSVKNKTIVTAMDKNNMKENLFTNIDSTILV